MTLEERARQARAAARAKVMVIRKTRLGQPELDLTPVKGADAISLTTRLTIEGFSLAGLDNVRYARGAIPVRFVPRTPA